MIGIMFIVVVTWVVVFVLHLASSGKIKYLDDINDHRLHDAIQSDLKRIMEDQKKEDARRKLLIRQIVRRNPKRRKGFKLKRYGRKSLF
jgi:hypothetical protein